MVCFAAGCQTNEEALQNVETYSGPLYEVNNVEILYSEPVNDELATVQFKLSGPKQLVFENENLEFPEGIYIENYDKEMNVVFTLKANAGYYDASEQVYRAVGNVEVMDMKDNKSLFTEELFWKPGPGNEAIYTDKFVHIRTQGESIRGVGLKASQDFSTYRILKPTGTLTIDEEEKP